jgi:hypothetical protein
LSVFEKFIKIRKNSADTQWRRRRNNQFFETRISAGFTELSAEFTEKSPTFPENRAGDSRTIFAETGRIFQKIGHWNKKIMKNNDMTSTKFVHANSP